MRGARKEAENQTADDENDGIGRIEAFCQGGEACDEEKQEKENQFDAVNAGGLHGGGGLKIAVLEAGG